MNDIPLLENIKVLLDKIDMTKLLAEIKEKNVNLQAMIKAMGQHEKPLSKTLQEINALMLEISEFSEVASLKLAAANNVLHNAINPNNKDFLVNIINSVVSKLGN